jgi:hypothetical protein
VKQINRSKSFDAGNENMHHENSANTKPSKSMFDAMHREVKKQ